MIDLTKAVVAALDSLSSIHGCYDRPADLRKYPYATLDGYSQLPWDTKGTNGFETTLVVHTFSQAPGKGETYQIQKDIYDKLHQQRLEVNGKAFLFFILDSQCFVDPDNKTFHGVQRFKVLSD